MSIDLNVDLTNFHKNVSDYVEPGQYQAVITDMALVESKAGDPMLNVYLSVRGGEFDGSDLVDRLSQLPQAMFRTVGFLQGLGLPTPRKKFTIRGIDKHVGRTVTVDVVDREYPAGSGTMTSNIQGYIPPKKSAREEAEEDLDDLPEAGSAATEDEAEEEAPAPAPVAKKAAARKPALAEEVEETKDLSVDGPEIVDLDEIEL